MEQLRKRVEAWRAQYASHQATAQIEAIFRDFTPDQLLDIWGSGRDRAGNMLSADQLGSLVENVLRVFGELPTEGIGTTARPLTPREQVTAARANELDAIPDAALLTRVQSAQLLGISVASLDRYARRCEPIGGVLLEPIRVGERGVRYKATNVKAVRVGLDALARRQREARLADRDHYSPPRRS